MGPGWMVVFIPALLFGVAAALFAVASVFAPVREDAPSRRLAGWAGIFALFSFASVCAVALWGIALWIGAAADSPGD